MNHSAVDPLSGLIPSQHHSLGPIWVQCGLLWATSSVTHDLPIWDPCYFGQGASEGPKWVYPTGSQVGIQGTHMGPRQN